MFLLITLIESRVGESVTITNPVPDCFVACLVKLLESFVKYFWAAAALVSTNFADYDAVFAELITSH